MSGADWYDQGWELYIRCGDKGKRDEPKALDSLIYDVLEGSHPYDCEALQRYLEKRKEFKP